MDASQNLFWSQRLQKENASSLRHVQSEMKSSSSGRASNNSGTPRHHRRNTTSTGGDQRRPEGSVVSALTSSTAALRKEEEEVEKMKQKAIPINLPFKENRKLKLLPKVPSETSQTNKNENKNLEMNQKNQKSLPLTKEVLETSGRFSSGRYQPENPKYALNNNNKNNNDANDNNNVGGEKKKQPPFGTSSISNFSGKRSSASVSSISKQQNQQQQEGEGNEQQQQQQKLPTTTGRSVSSSKSSSKSSVIGNWAKSVPTALPPIPSARGSSCASESAFSSTTLSHHAASTALVSGVTQINTRLEAIESRIVGEKVLRDELRAALQEVRSIVQKQRALEATAGGGGNNSTLSRHSSRR